MYLERIWDLHTCLLLAIKERSSPSPKSRVSLLSFKNWKQAFYLFCAWSWTWSKETYLSGKMSVISFSNQFSRCFSHNSGGFFLSARRGDPFIPCLRRPYNTWVFVLIICFTLSNHRMARAWMELTARKGRSLYTMPAPPPRHRYRMLLVAAFLSTKPRQKRGIHLEQTSASC